MVFFLQSAPSASASARGPRLALARLPSDQVDEVVLSAALLAKTLQDEEDNNVPENERLDAAKASPRRQGTVSLHRDEDGNDEEYEDEDEEEEEDEFEAEEDEEEEEFVRRP